MKQSAFGDGDMQEYWRFNRRKALINEGKILIELNFLI